jgi:hypothetical protein
VRSVNIVRDRDTWLADDEGQCAITETAQTCGDERSATRDRERRRAPTAKEQALRISIDSSFGKNPDRSTRSKQVAGAVVSGRRFNQERPQRLEPTWPSALLVHSDNPASCVQLRDAGDQLEVPVGEEVHTCPATEEMQQSGDEQRFAFGRVIEREDEGIAVGHDVRDAVDAVDVARCQSCEQAYETAVNEIEIGERPSYGLTHRWT